MKGIENRNLAVPFFLLTETHNFYESRDGNLQVSDVGQGLTFRCGRFQPHSCGNGRRKLESRLCCEGSPLLIPYPRYRRVAHDNGAACFHERAFNFVLRMPARLTRSFLVKSNFDSKNRAGLELSLRERATAFTSLRFLCLCEFESCSKIIFIQDEISTFNANFFFFFLKNFPRPRIFPFRKLEFSVCNTRRCQPAMQISNDEERIELRNPTRSTFSKPLSSSGLCNRIPSSFQTHVVYRRKEQQVNFPHE